MRVQVDFKADKVHGRISASTQKAQKWLDAEILKDCAPFVPRITGELERSGIRGTKIGGGLVVWNSPYARYQYYGKVMVDPKTGVAGFMTKDGWRSRKGVKKVLTDRDLEHSKQAHAKATRLWFESAKAQNKEKWINGVKKIGGGG